MSMSDAQLEGMATEMMSNMRGLGLGAPFLATCCDSLLMGVILCQMTHWIPMARHDVRHVRIIAGVVASAAILGTAYTWATGLNSFVYNFGSYSRFVSLDVLGWYGSIDMLIVVPVQILFSERSVRINGNSKILIVINSILIAATLSMGIATTVSTRNTNYFNRSQLSISLCTAWPTVCTCTHIFLTSTIIWGLYKSRSISERANKLLTRIIIVSIESQLPSTVIACLMTIIILVDNKSPMIPFIAIIHPKVFAIGALALINVRHDWRLKGKVPTSYTTGPSSMPHSRPTMVSLGSTAEDLGAQTPKAEWDDMDDLSRRRSTLSVMESGSLPMQNLKRPGNPFD